MCLNSLIVCKEGWYVGLGQKGLKEGGTGKKGGETKILKRDMLDQGVGALGRGLEPPCKLCLFVSISFIIAAS